MKTYALKLLGVFSILMFISCGGDDDYTPTETDTENPTPPTNLRISNSTDTSLQLNWEISTDNVGVIGYNVFQNDNIIFDGIDTNSTTISGLTPNTNFEFYVTAIDAAGNESVPSKSVYTIKDTENPTPPTNLTVTNKTQNSMQLNWDASTDNVSVVKYAVFQDGNMLDDNVTSTSLAIDNLAPETSYSFSVIAFDAAENQSENSDVLDTCTLAVTLEFKSKLSEMGVFTQNLSELTPAEGVQLYEINSTLFTDYAKKQRLIRLPNCEVLKYNGNDLLPEFPDNTLISKTFYYNINDQNPNEGRIIIETRIQLKINGNWHVGNYIWNEAQTDATYTENASVKPISYTNSDGEMLNIDYKIPSQQDCFTCHNNNDKTFPIGMKLRSMNFVPSYTNQNQLAYLESIGMMEGVTTENISVLPDWTDANNYDIFERGRAYIDVNCAHCHQPGGAVTNFGLDFRLETPFDETGIYANRGEIEARIQSTAPVYMMPQLGRTIVHEEAVDMLLEYLEAIED